MRTTMREMKARQKAKAEHVTKPPAPEEPPPSLEEEPEEVTDVLVDQGDGVRVRRSRRRVQHEEPGSYECPDEPPPGWGDGQ